ncbi:MAG: alpha/beta fold hydrolase, partial [bacterium]|nr:alpha/beta fold hydrolase [bacterium]
MKSERFTFTNHSGENLSARLDLPDAQDPIAYTLFAHFFTGTKNYRAVTNIAQALTNEGFAVFRLDFTGLGESEGEFEDTNLSTNVDDLVAASEHLKTHYEAPKILIGHSLGGAAVLQAAHKIPSSIAVATIGSPCEPSHVVRHFEDQIETIQTEGQAEVQIAGRPFVIKKQFLDDLDQTHMHETIRNLKRALLIFHSPVDNIVGIDNARHMFETALHPKSFICLDGADHLLSDSRDSAYVGSV